MVLLFHKDNRKIGLKISKIDPGLSIFAPIFIRRIFERRYMVNV